MVIFLYVFLFFGSMYSSQDQNQLKVFTLVELQEKAAAINQKIAHENLSPQEKAKQLTQLNEFKERFLKSTPVPAPSSPLPDHSSLVPNDQTVTYTVPDGAAVVAAFKKSLSSEEEEDNDYGQEENAENHYETQPHVPLFQNQPLNLVQLQQLHAQQFYLQQIQQQQMLQLFQQQQQALLQQNAFLAPQAAATTPFIENNFFYNSVNTEESMHNAPAVEQTLEKQLSVEKNKKQRRSTRKRTEVLSYQEISDTSDRDSDLKHERKKQSSSPSKQSFPQQEYNTIEAQTAATTTTFQEGQASQQTAPTITKKKGPRRSQRCPDKKVSYVEISDFSDSEEYRGAAVKADSSYPEHLTETQATAEVVFVDKNQTPINNSTELEVSYDGVPTLFRTSNTPFSDQEKTAQQAQNSIELQAAAAAVLVRKDPTLLDNSAVTADNDDGENTNKSAYAEEEDDDDNSYYEEKKYKRKKSSNSSLLNSQENRADLFECTVEDCNYSCSKSGTMRRHRSVNHPLWSIPEKRSNVPITRPNSQYFITTKRAEKFMTYTCTKCNITLSSILQVERHFITCFNKQGAP